jgi:phytoene synthase
MSAIYSTLLDEIESDGFKVLSQRTSLTPLRKLWLAWRTWVSARAPKIQTRAA